MARKSKGRQKVEMKKMHNDSNLQVTFSKRRSGLFKKASELCTLCGAEVVIIVFSPGNKVFSFGHPNVEALIARYVSGNNPQPTGAMQLVEANRNFNVRELNMQITQVVNALEIARKRGDELNKLRKESQERYWFDKPAEELTLPQLLQLQTALEELQKNVNMQHDDLIVQATTPQQQQFYMGHPGASSSSAPAAGGFLPYDPNMNMQQLNNNNNAVFNPNMNPNMIPNMNPNMNPPNMNQMNMNPNMNPPNMNQMNMNPNMNVNQMNMNQMMPGAQQLNNPGTGFNNNPGTGFGRGFY